MNLDGTFLTFQIIFLLIGLGIGAWGTSGNNYRLSWPIPVMWIFVSISWVFALLVILL